MLKKHLVRAFSLQSVLRALRAASLVMWSSVQMAASRHGVSDHTEFLRRVSAEAVVMAAASQPLRVTRMMPLVIRVTASRSAAPAERAAPEAPSMSTARL